MDPEDSGRQTPSKNDFKYKVKSFAKGRKVTGTYGTEYNPEDDAPKTVGRKADKKSVNTEKNRMSAADQAKNDSQVNAANAAATAFGLNVKPANIGKYDARRLGNKLRKHTIESFAFDFNRMMWIEEDVTLNEGQWIASMVDKAEHKMAKKTATGQVNFVNATYDDNVKLGADEEKAGAMSAVKQAGKEPETLDRKCDGEDDQKILPNIKGKNYTQDLKLSLKKEGLQYEYQVVLEDEILFQGNTVTVNAALVRTERFVAALVEEVEAAKVRPGIFKDQIRKYLNK
jgi:hypothetical protein